MQDLLKTLYNERPDDPLQLVHQVMSDQEWVKLTKKKEKLLAQV